MTRRPWSTGSVVAVAAAILLAGCSSSPKTPGTTAATTTTTKVPTKAITVTHFDSCLVVTQAQAASAINEPVTPGS